MASRWDFRDEPGGHHTGNREREGSTQSINIEVSDHDLVIVIPEKLELHNLTCDRSFFFFSFFALFCTFLVEE